MGPSPITGVLNRRERQRTLCEDTAGWRDAATAEGGQEGLEPPEAGRDRQGSSSGGLEGTGLCWYLHFRLLAPRTVRKYIPVLSDLFLSTG